MQWLLQQGKRGDNQRPETQEETQMFFHWTTLKPFRVFLLSIFILIYMLTALCILQHSSRTSSPLCVLYLPWSILKYCTYVCSVIKLFGIPKEFSFIESKKKYYLKNVSNYQTLLLAMVNKVSKVKVLSVQKNVPQHVIWMLI